MGDRSQPEPSSCSKGILPIHKIPAFPKARFAGCVREDESVTLDFKMLFLLQTSQKIPENGNLTGI